MIALVAVFAGACAASLFLGYRCVLPFSRKSALVLALFPLLLTGRAVMTASYYGPLAISYYAAPLRGRASSVADSVPARSLSDVQVLNLPWLKAVRESVKHGRMPYLNRFMLSGDSLLGTFQPMVFHPATLIGFLLPLATAWTFACTFHLFLAAFFAFLYFREIGVEELAALSGGAAWMLSNFLVFWVGWDIAPAFAPFPLLLVGLRRLVRQATGGTGITVCALVLALLAGHPETVLHEVAAGGIYFFFELRRGDRRGRAILRAAGAGLLALSLSAPALFPFLETLPQVFETAVRSVVFGHERKSVAWSDVGSAALLAVDPDRDGPRWSTSHESRTAQDGVSFGAGTLILALAAAGLSSRRREKWAIALVGGLALATALGMPGVADVVGRLPLFDIALNGRLAGIAAFCAVTLAVFGVEELARPIRGRAIAGLVAVSVLRIAVGLGTKRPAADAASSAAVSLLPVAILAMIAASRPRRVGAASLALLLPFRLADLPPLYPTYPASLFYPPVPEFSALPAGGEPYRVVGLGYSLPSNEAALWELEDPRGYTSMTNTRYLHLYPLWSVPQPVSYNRVDDPSRSFLSLLGVRFAIGAPQEATPAGWRTVVRGKGCSIFENPGALPRAFAPERVRFHAPSEDPLEPMNRVADFRMVGWVEDAALAGREVENGAAKVTTTRHGTDLSLDVDAKSPSWIIVTQTFWKGWRARLDGAAVPLSFGDYAFLAVRSPAGRHRIDLRFRPRSFTLGLAVAAAAALVLTLIALRRTAS